MSSLTRARVVLLCLLSAAAVLVAAGRPWIEVDLTGMLTGTPSADVAGTEAAPVVPAVALVALAAAAALSIAGRVGSAVASCAVAGAGLVSVWATISVLRAPVPAATASLGDTTAGLALDAEQVTVTAWPLVSAVLGAVLVAAGLLALAAGRGWQRRRRFEPGGPQAAEPRTHGGAVDDWDAISRGDDPTQEQGGSRG